MEQHLSRVHHTLNQRGVIPAMSTIISEVYGRNAVRHDPVLGDDATTFGITTSRNIANLAVQRLKGLPGVQARLVDTALEVSCEGYVLRQYKLAGSGCDASVDAISWEDSEAKLDGAIANSAVGQLTLDADLAAGPEAFAKVVPVMRHVRLVHAGDLETGECVIYLGIPRDNRDGGRPWFDIANLYGDPGGSGGQGSGPDVPRHPAAPAGPSYDELPEPAVELRPHSVPRPEEVPPEARS